MIQKAPVKFPVRSVLPFPRLLAVHRRLTITNGYTAAILIWKTSTPDPAERQSKTRWMGSTNFTGASVGGVCCPPHGGPGVNGFFFLGDQRVWLSPKI